MQNLGFAQSLKLELGSEILKYEQESYKKAKCDLLFDLELEAIGELETLHRVNCNLLRPFWVENNPAKEEKADDTKLQL